MARMGQFGVPNWLRRSIEAAVAAGLVAVVSLVGGRLSTGSDMVALPRGAAGALLLAPSVLALGVIPAAWPTGMAATRMDALFGAVAGFLIAADATVLLAGGRVHLEGTAFDLPAGFLSVILAAVPFLLGMAASQLAGPIGFGRNAGARSAILAAVAAVVVLGGVATLPGMIGPAA
jgi:hypothetical protein